MSRTENVVYDLLEENFPDSSEEIDKLYRPLEKNDPNTIIKINIKFKKIKKINNKIDRILTKRKRIVENVEKMVTKKLTKVRLKLAYRKYDQKDS
jgi:hypothetical protein